MLLLLLASAALKARSEDLPAPVKPVIKTQGYVPFAGEPIGYRSQELADPIAKLQERLVRNEISLEYDTRFGYLQSVLRALDVPVSSQTLVFSKTSFQAPQISPAAPRALYFNDDVYVGRVQQGKFLEFVSFDPNLGAIFYILDERRTDKPVFERSEVDCVQCHVAPSTHGVPGVMLRSVLTAPTGYQAASKPSFITGHESPFSERWGGWYVTAASGPADHMGNTVTPSPVRPRNRTTLAGLIDPTRYLTGSSDIVALMVLAHQTQMHNVITEASYRTRKILYAEQAREQATPSTSGQPSQTLSDDAQNEIGDLADRVVQYLLFANEAPLTKPVAGTSTFAREFSARGPRDPKGRSLRDLDLHTRLFKYPCSYLIYSEDFEAIPEPAKSAIYRRLFEVLSARDPAAKADSLTQQDRQAILEILLATKPGLPVEWKRFAEHPVTAHLHAPTLTGNGQPRSTERKSDAN
jgi:hypothetical protein